MVRDIEPVLSSQTSGDGQRLLGPIQIPHPALKASEQAVLVVWSVPPEVGERKLRICARGQRSVKHPPLTGGGKNMNVVLLGKSCYRLPADAALRAARWTAGYSRYENLHELSRRIAVRLR
jgi:hypothetical protein